MSKYYKYLGYFLALNIETVVILICSWFLGDYLDQEYPIGIYWKKIFIVFALILILRLWIVIIRKIVYDEFIKTHKTIKK